MFIHESTTRGVIHSWITHGGWHGNNKDCNLHNKATWVLEDFSNTLTITGISSLSHKFETI